MATAAFKTWRSVCSFEPRFQTLRVLENSDTPSDINTQGYVWRFVIFES